MHMCAQQMCLWISVVCLKKHVMRFLNLDVTLISSDFF